MNWKFAPALSAVLPASADSFAVLPGVCAAFHVDASGAARFGFGGGAGCRPSCSSAGPPCRRNHWRGGTTRVQNGYLRRYTGTPGHPPARAWTWRPERCRVGARLRQSRFRYRRRRSHPCRHRLLRRAIVAEPIAPPRSAAPADAIRFGLVRSIAGAADCPTNPSGTAARTAGRIGASLTATGVPTPASLG